MYFLFLCPALLLAQSAGTSQAESERYIVESEKQWAESVATGGTKDVERILADDFLGVSPQGKLYDKQEMIADTRNGPKEFVSNHLNQVKVRFYGDTAVAMRQPFVLASARLMVSSSAAFAVAYSSALTLPCWRSSSN